MKTQFILTVYNDSTSFDFMNMYHIDVFNTFLEALNAASCYDLPWQIKQEDEYVIEDGEIARPFPKRETHFTIEPDCDNWYDYDTIHETLQSARDEAARCIENEHCNCVIKQYHEVIVAYSKEANK